MPTETLSPTTNEPACQIKVRFKGERRFHFVTSTGTTTRLRLRAALIWNQQTALSGARALMDNAAETGVAAVAVMQDGKRILHLGEKTPPKPSDPYAACRYLREVTKAGRAHFHITDADGGYTDFDSDAYETCCAEAKQAGVSLPKGRMTVHAVRCLLVTEGVTFVQHYADGRPSGLRLG